MAPLLRARQLTAMQATVKGLENMLRKMRRMREDVPRSVERIVKMTAGQLCVEYARASGPGYGLTDTPLEKYQRKVEAQIRQIFPSSDRPYAVAKIIARRSEKLAKGYVRAMAQGKTAQARRYLREAGIKVEEFSREDHKSRRTGTGKSVPREAPVVAVVNSAKLRVYIREKKRRVGMAKAAWFQANQGLVKRVRVSARKTSTLGNYRRSFQRFPALVRAVARRFPGLGYSAITGTGLSVQVKIASMVKHGGDAADMAAMAEARAMASKGIAAAIAQEIAYLNKRLFS